MASRNGITERSRGNAWPTPLRDGVLVTPFRDALRTRRIYVFQEMTISLAVPDILLARAKSGDLEGYTHEEIAERMGKTVSFSKSQLARAHARLRGMLDDEGAAP